MRLALAAVLAVLGLTGLPGLDEGPPPGDARVTAVSSFHGRVQPIGPELRQRMNGVFWHRGCPVGLVDAYGADDHRSMDADNTPAFNCRFVAGSGGVWSQHAYGRALDLNPLENPYVTESGYVYRPPALTTPTAGATPRA